MSDKYKMHEQEKAYFLTMTVVGWIDVFTRKNHKFAIVDSLKYCQKHKGLEIYAWCLMPSHLHLIVRSTGTIELADIIRDFKKFTSRKIVSQIEEEPESRKEWMLRYFEYSGKHLKAIRKYKFWQSGNHAEIIYSVRFFYNTLAYIHNNPVKDMIVEKPEDYMFSSARNYASLDSLLDIVLESPRLITYN
jgi:REP element-mobilizing transposase RayT